ncbi:MAG: hypothetical protein ACH350_10155 [Parachlamydiaceae bacterium]
MNTNFNDLSWHDANLQFISIDRQKPGEQDVIKLLIDWPDNAGSSSIEFYDCYALTMNMNFGIVASESISTAECFTNSIELDFIRKEWSKVGVDLENLKFFKFTTNSTNNTIHIFSLGFQILSL